MSINLTNPEPWRQAVVAWYAGGPMPVMDKARRVGLSAEMPAKPKDRVRLLWLAGFDDEDLVAAVPELDADLVLRVAAMVHHTVVHIFARHLEGKTPLEISRDYDSVWFPALTRPKVYYWLTRLNLKPHRHVRDELNARQRAQIVSAYDRGDRLVDIAARFNVSYDQVRYSVKIASYSERISSL